MHGGIDTAYDPAGVRPVGERRMRVRVRGTFATPGADGIKTVTGTLELDCAANIATPIRSGAQTPMAASSSTP